MNRCAKTAILLSIFCTFQILFAGELSFQEVNAQHSNEEFRKIIIKGLKYLQNLDNNVAQATLKSVLDGRAKIDSLSDLTKEDFRRVLKDYAEDESFTLTLEDYPDLIVDGSKVQKKVEDVLAGYQWEDRIYIKLGQSVRDIAATIVHEVNHVINRSHISYYNSELDAFREEYRAFYVESLAMGRNVSNDDFTRKLKEQIIQDYSFKFVVPDNLANEPDGFLVPTSANWTRAAEKFHEN